MKIDSHHHFWNYTKADYGWIDDSMAKLRRDFLPNDLQEAIASVGIEGVVSVQARQSLVETEWLLSFAKEHDFIKGVVGWVDLRSAKVGDQLEKYSQHDKFCSVRHVVQDEPDDRFLLGDDFNRGIAQLKKHNLVYDILIFERHLPVAIEFVDRYPDQVFVLDHIAKPKIGLQELQPWQDNISELAKRDNVYCKVSGMVTEADFDGWTQEQLFPYWETVLEVFGPKRLMFGSDWPVCLAASEYKQWYQTVQKMARSLSDAEQEQLFGATAINAYQLKTN